MLVVKLSFENPHIKIGIKSIVPIKIIRIMTCFLKVTLALISTIYLVLLLIQILIPILANLYFNVYNLLQSVTLQTLAYIQ